MLLSKFWSFEIYLMPLMCRFSLYQTTKMFLFLLYWLTDLLLIVIGLLEFIVSLWNIWNIFTYVIPLRHDQKFSICKTSESYMKHFIHVISWLMIWFCLKPLQVFYNNFDQDYDEIFFIEKSTFHFFMIAIFTLQSPRSNLFEKKSENLNRRFCIC